MFIQGNLIGFGMVIITGIVIVIGHFLLKLPDVAVLIGCGITLIIVDLFLRLMKKNEKGWRAKTSAVIYFRARPDFRNNRDWDQYNQLFRQKTGAANYEIKKRKAELFSHKPFLCANSK